MRKRPKLVVMWMENQTVCPGMTVGSVYRVLRSHWIDGEGWYLLTDDQGNTYEVPDTFFEEV
jgi:hypothetical protein